MAKDHTGLKRFIVGKYVCPETDELIPVPSAVPMAEIECPVIVEDCPACGGRHEVCCDDLLASDESEAA